MAQVMANLANTLGVSEDTIYGWRRGDRIPDPSQIEQFAQIFVSGWQADTNWVNRFLEAAQYSPPRAIEALNKSLFGSSLAGTRTQNPEEPLEVNPPGSPIVLQSAEQKSGILVQLSLALVLITKFLTTGLKVFLKWGIASGLITLLAIGIYTNASRNEPRGLLAGSDCLPPPPLLNICPNPQSQTKVGFPIVKEQCNEVKKNFFVKTRAQLSESGKLTAHTQVLSDDYIFGFTGKATIHFCDGQESVHSVWERWGVHGRALPGTATHRVEDWDCPKGTAEKKKRCAENEGPTRNILPEDVLARVEYLHIVQENEASGFGTRLSNALQELTSLFN